MNRKIFNFKNLLILLPLFLLLGVVIVKTDVFAWTDCCTPSWSWTGWKYPGDGCCYSTWAEGRTERCCSLEDAAASCDEVVPCEGPSCPPEPEPEPEPGCGTCTPTCPTDAATSPNTGYPVTATCSNGAGCADSTLQCYYQRQNLCSNTSISVQWIKFGQTTTITSVANTNVNYFNYAFYNNANPYNCDTYPNCAPRPICVTNPPAGWNTTYQGDCPAGSVFLSLSRYFAIPRSSDTVTFNANQIFVNDMNWGGQLATQPQINGYYIISYRPLSLPNANCVEWPRLCYPLCTPTSCIGPTYTSTPTSYGSRVYTCTNSPSPQCGTESRTCYCSSNCTPANCPSPYSNTNTGYGTSTVTTTCTNACNVQRTRQCYCTNCIQNCPSPLSNTAVVADPNLILSNFRTCTNACGVSSVGHCYEVPTAQPTESLTVSPDPTNIYGFSSLTHTGIPGSPAGNLNDPIRMTATYTDTNGHADIEGVFVWFRDVAQTGTVTSPLWVLSSGSPSSPSTGSWGFMMHREGGTWLPYVTSYGQTPTRWVRAVYNATTRTFYVPGPNGQNMVKVILTSAPSSTGTTVTMPFSLTFSGTGIYENVSQVQYRIFLMGLDRFSFTPNDNYTFDVSAYWQPGQLRYRSSPTPAQTYSRAWFNTGQTRTIDKVRPTFTTDPTTTTTGSRTIRLDWAVQDDKNLYAVVGNVYTTAGAEARPITISTTTSGLALRSPVTFTPTAENPNVTSRINSGWTFRMAPNMTSTTHTGNLTIDVGENRVGSLIFYVTVFDDAGNMEVRSTTLDLNDWFVTDGGLAYSAGGTRFQTKSPTIVWGTKLPPFSVSGWTESLTAAKADFSSEMWAEATTAPLKSTTVQSYSINGHGSFTVSGYYDVLKEAYEENKSRIIGLNEVTSNVPEPLTLAGNMNNPCGSHIQVKYCVFFRNGDLSLSSGLSCNHRAVVFVDGNLTINPSISNSISNRDACIFVVKGNVTITEGSPISTNSEMRYDQINAYVLAEGTLTINHETSKATTAIFDGVYINGGIHSLGGTTIRRYLRLQDRLNYPVVAIDHHSKYGVLGGVIFGSNFTMQKTEIGFKPY